ncbi:MAG TPA: glutamine-synthetase adenylyltransferase, partial [Rhodanobacteraceae bacterium]
AGDPGLRSAFQRERAALLALPRDPARVAADLLKMRAQWRAERDRSSASRFDLKQGAGGLLDIEFLLQGLVLRHAARHPGLTAPTDTPGLIAASAAAGVLPERDAQELLDAHAALLARALNCTLEATPRVLERDAELSAACAGVLRVARDAGFDLSAT